jgi:ferric-dicitrate binding protein FerR (iron transport regulator)
MQQQNMYQAQLLDRYLHGIATPGETRELFAWLKENDPDSIGQLEDLMERHYAEAFAQSPGLTDADSNRVLTRILYKMHQGKVRETRVIWYRVAAASIALLLAGALLYFLFPGKSQPPAKVTMAPIDVQAPQLCHAVITLANGSKVLLDSAVNGQLALQGNVKLVKLANGQIAYKSQRPDAGTGKLAYNTITNPRGSQVIDMALSDGSRVWLNAGSSMTYPVAFGNHQRKVSITGEAYFEVARDQARPFHVTTGKMDVQVLGTHFNVNTYDNEQDMKVTLLEGSVRVTNPTGSVTIHPGEQASLPFKEAARPASRCDITVQHANIAQVMSWKNGLFDFDGINLKEAMPELERWYAITVRYEPGVGDVPLFGKIDRSLNLSDLLDLLRGAGFRFRLEEGRTLVLTK